MLSRSRRTLVAGLFLSSWPPREKCQGLLAFLAQAKSGGHVNVISWMYPSMASSFCRSFYEPAFITTWIASNRFGRNDTCDQRYDDPLAESIERIRIYRFFQVKKKKIKMRLKDIGNRFLRRKDFCELSANENEWLKRECYVYKKYKKGKRLK